MKKLKIINRNKFVRTILIILSILAIVICIFINNSYSNSNLNYKQEYINKGDTLWSIAEEEIRNNPYYKDEDVRKVIYEIRELNNLKTSDLIEGVQIKIPVY